MKGINLANYSSWVIASTDPLVRKWMKEEAVKEDWLTWLDDLWAKQRTSEFGERFARFCPCPGTKPDDYWPREIELDRDTRLIAGINEHSGFFVRVYAQSRMLKAEEYADFGEELLRRFGVFRPSATCWWLPSGVAEISGNLNQAEETRLLVGKIQSLNPSLPAVRGVMHELTELDPSFYAAYVEMYERFYVEFPHMRGVVRIESEEALRGCARSGKLFAYEVDGEIAGVFAASLGREPPISGWCAVEAILDSPYRGRGLAAAALLEMLRSLEVGQSKLVFATIAGVNTPSLRMARRVGLCDVGGWVTLSSVALR